MMRFKILIADDSPTIRMLTRAILGGRGFDFQEAPNGVEALERIKAFQPHLVVLDVFMPVMGGIECCRRIKSDARCRDTKVIMLSDRQEPMEIADAFRAGCDDYITKPINQEELTRKVQDLFEYVICRRRIESITEEWVVARGGLDTGN